MKHPKISIITPSFNQGEFIKDTIESIRAQNYSNVEHIVVDGGSTDSTLDVLKSYPDLIWTSEPDNGQTDALNKGFAKATGDIVTWLNSDDWYAPEVLHTVANEIGDNDILMGTCQITDREGKPDYTVPNVERTWFDLLKYWVPYSIPTQPSIFFTRQLLQQSALGENYFLDEDLYFCMDYDLWMRFWLRSKVKRVEKLFSFYRMYEDNKTSQMKSAEPEMSRVFRRNCYRSAQIEKSLSFIVPCSKIDLELESTLGSIVAQTSNDYEVILVDFADDKTDSKAVKSFVLEAHTSGKTPFRYAKAQSQNVISAFHEGVRSSSGLYQAFLAPGLVVNSEYCMQVCNAFAEDKAALVLPQGVLNPLRDRVRGENGVIALDGLLFAPYVGLSFAVRKIALQDMGLLRESYTLPSFLLRELLSRCCHKGWGVDLDCEAQVEGKAQLYTHEQEETVFQNLCLAQIVTDCSAELAYDPFAIERVRHGVGLFFDEELIRKSHAILQGAPENWFAIDYSNVEELKRLTASHTQFAPGWFYFSRICEKLGDTESAEAHWKQYEHVQAQQFL